MCITELKEYWYQMMYPCLAWNVHEIHARELALKNSLYQNNV